MSEHNNDTEENNDKTYLQIRDMDGTLLDDNKQLPKNFDNIVKRLFNKNIRFVISSGRSYCTLKKQFSEYLDDMTFICDNGAYVVDKGKLLSVSVLPKDTVKEAVRFSTN